MTSWIRRFRVMLGRLWCQLAISYALLAFGAMSLLMMLMYAKNDYSDFYVTYTPANIERILKVELPAMAQALRHPSDTARLMQAQDAIRYKLIHMENGSDGPVYRISNSSRPSVSIQIVDRQDRVLLSDPIVFPEQSSSQNAGITDGRQLTSAHKPIWIDMPITDGDNIIIGHLRVLYAASFDPWVQFTTIVSFLLNIWDYLLLCSVPIGVACGWIAARYVTRQLQKMNVVTESWRQGHFEARIALPNDDVLMRHSQHLNGMAADLAQLVGLKNTMAVTDERNRVARELHDTVKQKLFALGLQLATAKSKPAVMEVARDHILEAELITREAQHDVMEIITQLRPAATTDDTLSSRMGALADDFRRRFDVVVDIDLAYADRFTAQVEHHLVRIVQEALMNAVRHGRATHITIRGRSEQGRATLVIADNGCGFDTGRSSPGFGMTSMRERAHGLAGGAFDIQSTANVGTTMTLSWDHAA